MVLKGCFSSYILLSTQPSVSRVHVKSKAQWAVDTKPTHRKLAGGSQNVSAQVNHCFLSAGKDMATLGTCTELEPVRAKEDSTKQERESSY